ncbi:flagellar FliJ protein [Carnobacterium iners]|uniref:Flagellar FliJ protein n=1 Tax=Carnobacterium iners TaxID=1073423 RepID=A0A1X7N0G4_9LACT|nr:flagellar export protein FliJ [Carnobacterium iners]SEK21893.1 flagellar FliJ protein [Carnobacterium iners]SMH30739.1 flagellar FliJ protein [Carnobacterium iners]
MLSKFKFSMEKVLDWRSDTEETKKKNLGDTEREKTRQENLLQDMVQENIKIKNETLTTTRIDILRRQNMYKVMLDERIIQQKNQIDIAKKSVDIARLELMEAHKEKKVMEKLKEKEFNLLTSLEKSEEQKQLDEIATLSYGRTYY